MNYKIIRDEQAFKDFIKWLPELKDGDKYYFSLFARSKYDDTGILKADKSQLKRGVSDKKQLFDKIKKLEVERGLYVFDGVEVPEESLALYITANPRSMKKASFLTAKKLLDNIEKEKYQNPSSIALNAIQVSKSRTEIITFDFDYKESKGYLEDLQYWVKSCVGNLESFAIVETKGGYHIHIFPKLVHTDKVKTFYQKLKENQFIDQSGDLLTPVVGCTQGNFIPKFVY